MHPENDMEPIVQNWNNYRDREPRTSLWGTAARRVTGSFQVVMGVLEIILGISVIALPLTVFQRVDNVGWGIWCGAFSILTGCFGIGSHRNKCIVIAYLVLSVIAACMCVYPIVYLAFAAKSAKSWEQYGSYRSIDASIEAHFRIYVTLIVVMFLQGVSSIIGASFTCKVLYSSPAASNQHVMYYVPNETQQTAGLASPPNTVYTAGPPPRYRP